MNEGRSNGQFAHGGLTLAEIERRLQVDGHPQDEIDMTLAFVMTVREQLARIGKWPPPKGELVA